MRKKTTIVISPQPSETQLHKAWTHIKGQFWGGIGIGLVIFFVVQIAQNQSFAKSCIDIFTEVHPILFMTGFVGMFTYMLARGP